jgi:flagellar basal body-associated protein FliL
MSQKEEPKSPEAPAKKGGGPGVLMLIMPAVLAGGAAFGAVKFGAAHAAAPPPQAEQHHHASLPPPGPTLALEPFVVVTLDSSKKTHPMKVSLAVEFEANPKESKEEGKDDSLKGFIPRIRDATLSYLRLMTYEDALDSNHSDKMRSELLEKVRAAGAMGAERVLVTDLVVQ